MRSAVRIVLALGLAAGAPAISAATGEEAPLLELDDAVAIALGSNRTLRAADAAVGAAEAGVEEARAGRLPGVDLDLEWSRTTNPTLVFSNLLGQEAFGPENFAIDALNRPDALNNVRSRISVSQPVWTGGRIERSIDAAEASRGASAAERERTRQAVVHRVIEAYTGAVLAGARLGVAEDAAATAAEHVRLVSDLHEGGLVVASDLLQARVRALEVDETRIRAESDLAVSRAALNLALGRDLDTPFRLSAALDAPLPLDDESLEDLLAAAATGRPDARAARLAVEASDLGVSVARAGRMPRVGVGGSYEANSEDWFDPGGTNWSLFAGASWTIFDGKATGARIRRAERELDRARARSADLEDSVGLDVRRAYHERRAARSSTERTAQAVELARESLRIVEDRYREGLTTVVELLDAQTAVTEARFRDLAARRDLILADASLDLAVGRL